MAWSFRLGIGNWVHVHATDRVGEIEDESSSSESPRYKVRFFDGAEPHCDWVAPDSLASFDYLQSAVTGSLDYEESEYHGDEDDSLPPSRPETPLKDQHRSAEDEENCEEKEDDQEELQQKRTQSLASGEDVRHSVGEQGALLGRRLRNSVSEFMCHSRCTISTGTTSGEVEHMFDTRPKDCSPSRASTCLRRGTGTMLELPVTDRCPSQASTASVIVGEYATLSEDRDTQWSCHTEPLLAQRAFVYMRHGESYGNAKRIGHIADGKLTPARVSKQGEVQAQRRIDIMAGEPAGQDGIQKLSDSEWVLTSPLRRAMATSLIVLARVRERLGIPQEIYWSRKKVRVVNELREKMMSSSEVPGAGGAGTTSGGKFSTKLESGDWNKVRRYLNDICKRYDIEWGIRDGKIPEDGLLSFAERMWLSYEAVRRETDDFNRDAPRDGVTFLRNIRKFKDTVIELGPGLPVAIFGHSGWSRFAFAPWFPPAENGLSGLQAGLHGFREAHGLNNCGVVTGSYLLDGSIDPDSISMDEAFGDATLPQFDTKTCHVCLSDFGDAKRVGVIPADLQMVFSHRWGQVSTKGKLDEQWFFVTHSSERGWLTWGKGKWLGGHVNIVDVCGGSIRDSSTPGLLQMQFQGVILEVAFRDAQLSSDFKAAFEIAAAFTAKPPVEFDGGMLGCPQRRDRLSMPFLTDAALETPPPTPRRGMLHVLASKLRSPKMSI